MQVNPFPITSFPSRYEDDWTDTWTKIGDINYFFASPLDIKIVSSSPWNTTSDTSLARREDDWGSFFLVGRMIITKVFQIGYKIKCCGDRTNLDYRYLDEIGTVLKKFDGSKRAYLIPGRGDVNLTIVVYNFGELSTEAYFLKANPHPRVKSRLPGMDEFYRNVAFNNVVQSVVRFCSGKCGN